MKIEAILEVIRKLACTQGFYGRLYRDLMNAKEYEPDIYADTVAVLEEQCFSDPVELIMFLEG